MSVPLQERLPEGSQTHFRSIVTDQHCRVLGSNGSIYAIGDAATIQQVNSSAQLPTDSPCLSAHTGRTIPAGKYVGTLMASHTDVLQPWLHRCCGELRLENSNTTDLWVLLSERPITPHGCIRTVNPDARHQCKFGGAVTGEGAEPQRGAL